MSSMSSQSPSPTKVASASTAPGLKDPDLSRILKDSAEKRAVHNALERKRRDHIKDMFSQLKDSVPNLAGEKVSPKASRAQILKKACDYIQLMRRKNTASTKELQHINQQITRTKKQIAKLESVRNTNRYVATLPAGAQGEVSAVVSSEDGLQAARPPSTAFPVPVPAQLTPPRPPQPQLQLQPQMTPFPVTADHMQMLMGLQNQGLMPRGLVPLSMPLPNMASTLHQLYMRQQQAVPSSSPSGPPHHTPAPLPLPTPQMHETAPAPLPSLSPAL